jgi:hypothetical protein
MEYMLNWYSQWDDCEAEAVKFLDGGKAVLVVTRERGRMARTGIEVEEEFKPLVQDP